MTETSGSRSRYRGVPHTEERSIWAPECINLSDLSDGPKPSRFRSLINWLWSTHLR